MSNVFDMRGGRSGAWLGEITRGERGPHPTVSNTMLVLGNDDKLAGLLAYDEFAHQVVITREPPRPYEGANGIPGPYPRALTDSDVTMLQGFVQRAYSMRISSQVARQAAEATAELNRFHPVRDWLNGLEWDKKPRLETWLHTAFGVPLDSYHSAVAVKVLCAAVRRVRSPGTKFDHVLVLEGDQGKGKSRACETLFGARWFKDDLSHDLGDKDAQQGMAGRWGIELAELQVLVRSTSQAAKSFISRQVDHFRPSYGRSFVERPRQCIFIGTTNEKDWLTDTTGNRRYWPIVCTRCDVDWIHDNREQLWAEAAVFEEDDLPLWLEDEAVRKDAEVSQESRMAEDVWHRPIATYVQLMTETTSVEILHTCLVLPRDRQNRASEMRVAAILRALGWLRHDFRRDGRKTRAWFAPGASLPGTGRFVPALAAGDGTR